VVQVSQNGNPVNRDQAVFARFPLLFPFHSQTGATGVMLRLAMMRNGLVLPLMGAIALALAGCSKPPPPPANPQPVNQSVVPTPEPTAGATPEAPPTPMPSATPAPAAPISSGS
jgi:hypothetical protein